ncbi:MAG TPA: hypothetical protein VGB94_01655, partial [Acidobacteriaceae bacterium]
LIYAEHSGTNLAPYQNYLYLRDRPTDAVLNVGLNGNNPSTPYYVFRDTSVFGGLSFNPALNRFGMTQLDAQLDFTVGNMPPRDYLHFYGDGFGPIAGVTIAAVAGGLYGPDVPIYLAPAGAGSVDVSKAKITNVGNGSAATDAVAYGQVSAVGRSGSANDIATGTLADARLSTNVDLLNAAQTITGAKSFSGTTYFGSSSQASIDASGNIATSGRVAPQQGTPGSSSDACNAGQMWSDGSYIYVCTAKNTIKRAALSSF